MEVTGTGTAATIADVDDLTDLDVIPALGAPLPVPQGAGSFAPSRHPDERRLAQRTAGHRPHRGVHAERRLGRP